MLFPKMSYFSPPPPKPHLTNMATKNSSFVSLFSKLLSEAVHKCANPDPKEVYVSEPQLFSSGHQFKPRKLTTLAQIALLKNVCRWQYSNKNASEAVIDVFHQKTLNAEASVRPKPDTHMQNLL